MVKLGFLVGLLVLLTMTAFARDVQMVVINGHRMVSLRAFGETFGATIDYDNNRDGVCISLDYQNVNIVPYSRIAWINERRVTLDAPMVIIDDVTYVPIDFLCDAFDFSSNRLDADQYQISIRLRPAFRVILVRDIEWGRRQHQWRYSYTARDYANMHYGTDRNHNTPSDRNNGRYDRNNNNANSDQRPNRDWRQGGNNNLPRSTDRNNNTPNDRNNGRYDRNNNNANSNQRPNTDWRQGGNNNLPRSTDRNNNTPNDRTNGSYDRNNNTNGNQRPNSNWRQGGNNNLPPRVNSGSRPQDTPRQYNNTTPARRPGTVQERDTTRDPARQGTRYQSGNKTPRENQSVKDQKNSKTQTQQDDKKNTDDNKGRKDN